MQTAGVQVQSDPGLQSQAALTPQIKYRDAEGWCSASRAETWARAHAQVQPSRQQSPCGHEGKPHEKWVWKACRQVCNHIALTGGLTIARPALPELFFFWLQRCFAWFSWASNSFHWPGVCISFVCYHNRFM